MQLLFKRNVKIQVIGFFITESILIDLLAFMVSPPPAFSLKGNFLTFFGFNKKMKVSMSLLFQGLACFTIAY